MDNWGWLVGFEAFLMFGLVLGWGWRELAALGRLRRARAERPDDAPDRPPGGRGAA